MTIIFESDKINFVKIKKDRFLTLFGVIFGVKFMKNLSAYTVPFYYPAFSCKCGDCRYTCCQRWRVSLTIEEYNRLISIECSDYLRHKLDGAAYSEEHPTPEKYASLLKRPDGFCAILEPDGFCAFHRECGETALPSVCRYYPRSPRGTFADECSCSCGCEGVTEALLNHDGDFELTVGKYEFELPKEARDNRVSEEIYKAVRQKCFDILNNKSASVQLRLAVIGDLLEKISPEFDAERIIEICDSFSFESKNYETNGLSADPLEIQRTLNDIFCSKSPNMIEYSDYADTMFFGDLKLLGDSESFMDFYGEEGYSNRRFVPSNKAAQMSYADAKAQLFGLYPDLCDKLSLLLANHIFFTRFPYGGNGILPSYMSLVAAYGLMLYIASGCLAGEESGDIAPLADVLSALFRVMDGSSFNINAAKVFVRYGISSFESAKSIIFGF